MSYVICPVTMSSPAPSQDWIPANMPCGAKAGVVQIGPVMAMRCPRGHTFYATPEDVVEETA